MKDSKSFETASGVEPSKTSLHAPTGLQRSCRGWCQEAALRMLMNSLNSAVAERPEELVVHVTIQQHVPPPLDLLLDLKDEPR